MEWVGLIRKRSAEGGKDTRCKAKESAMVRTIGIAFVGCLVSCICGAQQMSTVCKFTRGPASGTTHNYAPFGPAPVGTGCNDGKGSTGYVIPPPPDKQHALSDSAGNPNPADPQGGSMVSTICSFDHGPAAGTTQHSAPFSSEPEGTPCNDGRGSTGTMIARLEDPPARAAAPVTRVSVSQQMGTVCSFNRGPASGTTHDYASLTPVPLGTPCNDGLGSTGTIIARAQDPPPPAAAPATNASSGQQTSNIGQQTSSSSQQTSSIGQQTSTVCSFNHGPAAGTTHDYAPLDPLPVGATCNDGNGSTGTIIPKADNPATGAAAPASNASVGQPMTTVCSFNQGPAAGTSHDYAPLDPLPVGAACNDGKGSTGTMIAKPQAPATGPESAAADSHETSTLCKFTSGPAAGTMHDYAPLDPLPVGTACNNGAGSTGVIIAPSTNTPPPANTPSYGGSGPATTSSASTSPASASAPPSYAGMGTPQMSTVCKFTSGPAAGTLHDYAPLDPIAVGSTCNDGKGSTGTVIPRSQSRP
jgi:hypothetical protein